MVYSLNIEYEAHTVTATGGLVNPGFSHSYRTIVVRASVMADDYESTLSSIRVDIFPFWVDTSSWATGESVSISGNIYTISEETQFWKAHRSVGNDGDYVDIYYDKEIGIFIRSYSDFMILGSSGFQGSTVSIEVQQSNFAGFISIVYGTNVVVFVLLISGIFTEIPIIVWLWNRREKQKTTKKSQQTSTPSAEG